MAKAFIYVERPYEDDDYTTVSVLEDDSTVLLMEVEESGSFELEEFVDNIFKVKQGYYFVEYDWYMETEIWEIYHVEYPVIDEWDMRKVWYGWFLDKYLRVKHFILRTNKYGFY